MSLTYNIVSNEKLKQWLQIKNTKEDKQSFYILGFDDNDILRHYSIHSSLEEAKELVKRLNKI